MTDLPARPAGQASIASAASAAPTTDSAGRPEQLACGAQIDALVDQVDAGRLEPADAHQASCAYCQAALRDTATSSRALDLLRVDRGPVPADLVDRVMRRMRRSRGAPTVLELPLPGTLRVAGGIRVHLHVLARIARAAAGGEPGVTVTRSSAALAGEAGRVVLRVALGLLVDGRTPLPDVATSLRRAVRVALREATGLRDVEVELAALDLVPRDRVGPVPVAPQLFGPDGV